LNERENRDATFEGINRRKEAQETQKEKAGMRREPMTRIFFLFLRFFAANLLSV
jgi:hypothetical protein